MAQAEEKGKKVLLPVDLVAAAGIDQPETAEPVAVDALPADKMALDIGPETIKRYQAAVADAKTIIWNGPMGVFEVDAFAQGTNLVAEAVGAQQGQFYRWRWRLSGGSGQSRPGGSNHPYFHRRRRFFGIFGG